ncbi:molybdate ABC transporter substrate-binding protein [Sagittula sp. P11]|uniref:molybdate ABC transporter substrate-binding protein n=1 Tax=Sagittula sp. P11 TaxID=2009329 RepID=UPI000C2D68D4|nr:molybdate ABC transporter substrate-binding protein [Sagittula sp. P11]AUC54655.1 molybdate ABC transporter substrate-binding protein [Sagittula sp. P11]
MIRAAALCLLAGAAQADPMLLAAASTGAALDAAIEQSGIAALTSYGASGLLARQIEQGAPADLFVSANPKWMGHLVEAGLVEGDAVRVLMSNRLVLIAPSGSRVTPDTLATALEGEVFAMADPETAPVGAYGKAALESLGLWDEVAPAFVPMRNTLATVAAVAQGEAALGLVYASDAAGQPGIAVVWQIPEDSHPPIRYLVAPVAQGDDPEGASALMAFLVSPAGQAVLAAQGFVTLPATLPAEGS